MEYISKLGFILLLPAMIFFSGCSLTTGGSDGGVFRSDDGGKSFSQKVTVDEDTRISGVDVLSLKVNPQNGQEVYVGTKAHGIFKSENGAEDWRQLRAAERIPVKIYSLALDPMNSQVVYATAVIDGRGKIMKSEDGGENWKETYTEPSNNTLVLSLAIDPQNPSRIFSGTSEGLILLSENGGESWRNVHIAGAEVYKIAIDDFRTGTAYFIVFGRTILRTRDGGNTFEDLGEKEMFSFDQASPFRNPTAITVDPHNPGWVWAGSEGGLFRSQDEGETWEAVRILLKPQEQEVHGIGINPQNSNEIIFGASQAFYKSIDGGLSWSTVQYGGTRSIAVTAYDRQNPSVIYVGVNK